jgi:hypothetical protein
VVLPVRYDVVTREDLGYGAPTHVPAVQLQTRAGDLERIANVVTDTKNGARRILLGRECVLTLPSPVGSAAVGYVK